MPELPEVENFRRLLLPLVSSKDPLILRRCSLEKAPPRRFLADDEITDINNSKFLVAEVLRKGKLICIVLNEKTKGKKKTGDCPTKYLFLHMGMTGRISTPQCIPKLKELSDTEIYPPPYTYLQLSVGSSQACFSDPRKFGAIYLKDSLEKDFAVLAPDAWMSTRTARIKVESIDLDHVHRRVPVPSPVDESTLKEILAKLTEQSMGIKGVLLDQKRALCGVGNWVADEVLYQTKMHPDQNYLTQDEAKSLLERLHIILDKAVHCLYDDQEFPQEWLFHYRWSKRGSNKTTIKDAHGRSIVFVTSGGRTSAVVPSIQKKRSRKSMTTISGKKDEKNFKKTVTKKKRVTSKSESDLEVKKSVQDECGESVKKIKLEKKARTTSSNRTQKVTPRSTARRSPRLAKL